MTTNFNLHLRFYVCQSWLNGRGGLFSRYTSADYNKISTPGPVPKYWLGFSYICSENNELELNFVEPEMKRKMKSDHSSNDKVKLFSENIMVIKEECFDDMNLSDGVIFLMDVIKSEESIFTF